MTLSIHHRAALVGAAATSAIALTDAITVGITGHNSVFSDDTDMPLAAVLGAVAHGLTYAALVWVLLREVGRFQATGPVTRVTRWVVTGSLAFLAAAFTLVVPVLVLTGTDGGTPYAAWGVLGTVAFIGMILGSLVLSLAQLRSRCLGLGARVLGLMLPVAGLTMLLGWLVPDWAHPAYLETTLHFGLALLGVRAVADREGGDAPERTSSEVVPTAVRP